jgi:hypothetical protein
MSKSRKHALPVSDLAWRAKVEVCQHWVIAGSEELDRSLEVVAKMELGPYISMRLALGFALESLRAIKDLLYRQSVPQAAVLTRSLLELSTRTLWAVNMPNGWNRLIVLATSESAKRARELDGFGGFKAICEKALKNKEDVDGLLGCGPAPQIAQMLRDIEEADVRRGFIEKQRSCVTFEYASVFKDMITVAHPNPVMLTLLDSLSLERNVVLGCIHSAYQIVRALWQLLGKDWQPIAGQTAELITGKAVGRKA